MLIKTETGAKGIVIELDEITAPKKKIRLAIPQHGVHGDQKRLRPILNGAERRGAPVKSANEVGHFSRSKDQASAWLGQVFLRLASVSHRMGSLRVLSRAVVQITPNIMRGLIFSHG